MHKNLFGRLGNEKRHVIRVSRGIRNAVLFVVIILIDILVMLATVYFKQLGDLNMLSRSVVDMHNK